MQIARVQSYHKMNIEFCDSITYEEFALALCTLS